MKFSNEKGSLIIETSIVLPLFILVIVSIYGIFNIVNAENQMIHTLVQTTESLSMDKYINKQITSVLGYDSYDQVESLWNGLDDAILELVRIGNDEHFSSKIKWYDLDETQKVNVAKKRFIGYLADGDEKAADKKLKALGIENGLEGLSFHVQTTDDFVTVNVKFTVTFWIDWNGLGKIPMDKTAVSHFWS